MALNVGTLFAMLQMDSSQFTQALRNAESGMRNLGGNLSKVGKTMSAAVTVPLVAMGYGVVKTIAQFDDQMATLRAITRASGKEMEIMRDKAKELGATTQFSATDAAQAMTFLGQAGWDTSQIMTGIPDILNLAAAGGISLASAADIGSSVIAGFGLTAKDAAEMSNVLALAANATNSDVSDLGMTMKYVAPIAKAYGMSLQEASAMAGMMANAGIKGSDAGTSLRAGLVRLAAPPTEAAKALDKLRVATIDTHGKMLPVAKVIEQLQQKFKGLTQAQQIESAARIFGQEAMSGWLAVLNEGAPSLEKMTEMLNNSAGAADEARKIMEDSVGGAFRNMSSAIEGLVLSFEDILIPILRTGADFVAKMATAFSKLDGTTKLIIVVVTALAAALGPVLIVVGALVSAIGAIGLPVVAVIAGIAALAAAFGILYAKSEGFRNVVNTVFTAIKNIVMQVIGVVVGFLKEKLDQIKQFWAENGAQITQAAKNVWYGIQKVIEFVMPAIKFVIEMIWGNIKGVINGALNIILGLVKTFAALFTGDWAGVWEGIKRILKGAIELIWNLMQLMFIGRLLKGIGAFFGLLKGLFTSGWGAITAGFKAVVKAFQTIWEGGGPAIWNAVKMVVTKVWNFFADLRAKMLQIGGQIIQGLINGLKNAASGAVKAAKGVAKSVGDAFLGFFQIHSPSRWMMDAGGNIVQGLADGMEKKTGKATDSAKKVSKKVADTFTKEMSAAKDSFKLGKLDADQYIAELEKIKNAHKKNAAQVNKVELEIKKVRDDVAKHAIKTYADIIEAAKKDIDTKKFYNQLTLEQELKMWNGIVAMTKAGTEQRIDAEKQVYTIKQQIRQRDFENAKADIERRAKYEGLSLIQQLNSYETVSKRYEKGSKERIEIEQKMVDIKQQIAEQLKQIDEEYLKSVEERNAKLIADEQALTDAYNKAVEDRTRSLTDFAGIFDEVTKKSDVSGQQLLNNLQGQVVAFQEWQQNIARLANMGIDQGLLAELQAMGPKAGDEIAALTQLTGPQLDQYVALWQEKNKLAKDQAIAELEPLKAETAAKIEELRLQAEKDLETYKATWTKKMTELRTGVKTAMNPMKDDLKTIGTNAMNGLIAGLQAMQGPLQKKAEEIANSVSATMKKALQIKSPSRVTMGIGKFVGEGLVGGMANMLPDITDAASLMAKASVPNISPVAYPQANLPQVSFVPQLLGNIKEMLSGTINGIKLGNAEGGPSIVVHVTGNNFADGNDAGRQIHDALRRLGL